MTATKFISSISTQFVHADDAESGTFRDVHLSREGYRVWAASLFRRSRRGLGKDEEDGGQVSAVERALCRASRSSSCERLVQDGGEKVWVDGGALEAGDHDDGDSRGLLLDLKGEAAEQVRHGAIDNDGGRKTDG